MDRLRYHAPQVKQHSTLETIRVRRSHRGLWTDRWPWSSHYWSGARFSLEFLSAVNPVDSQIIGTFAQKTADFINCLKPLEFKRNFLIFKRFWLPEESCISNASIVFQVKILETGETSRACVQFELHTLFILLLNIAKYLPWSVTDPESNAWRIQESAGYSLPLTIRCWFKEEEEKEKLCEY